MPTNRKKILHRTQWWQIKRQHVIPTVWLDCFMLNRLDFNLGSESFKCMSIAFIVFWLIEHVTLFNQYCMEGLPQKHFFINLNLKSETLLLAKIYKSEITFLMCIFLNVLPDFWFCFSVDSNKIAIRLKKKS